MPDEQVAESSPATASESSPEDRFYEDGPIEEAAEEPEEGEPASEPEGESEPESEPGSKEPVDERTKRSERDKARNAERIERLLQERADYKARAEFYERQEAERRNREQQPQQPQPREPKVPAETGKPKLPKYEDFQTIQEHEEAMAKYESDLDEYHDRRATAKLRQELEAFREKEREEAQLQQQQRYVQERDSRFEDEVKKLSKEAAYTDINEAINRVLELPEDQRFGPVLADFMGRYEHGARIAHYLAKNDAERTRITRLSPTDQWKEATELLVRLKPRAQAPRQRTKPDHHPTDLGTSSTGPPKTRHLEDVFYGD